MDALNCDLKGKKCVPCEGGTPPLTEKELEPYLPQVPDWRVEGGRALAREFKFKDFAAALVFINQLGAIAEAEGHHPDINLHDWNRVKLTLTTHAVGGLSENDFILAFKINALKK